MGEEYPDTKRWTNLQKEHWIQDHSRLIWKNVMQFLDFFNKTPSIDLNDLYQIACMGILYAFDTYNPDRDTKFSTYAVLCIKSHLSMSVRREYALKRHSDVSSLDDENIQDLLQHKSLSHKICTPEDLYVNQEQLQSIYDFLEAAEGEDAHVMFTLLCNEITQSNAAHLINCSQSNISSKVKKIRRELTAKFQDA